MTGVLVLIRIIIVNSRAIVLEPQAKDLKFLIHVKSSSLVTPSLCYSSFGAAGQQILFLIRANQPAYSRQVAENQCSSVC